MCTHFPNKLLSLMINRAASRVSIFLKNFQPRTLNNQIKYPWNRNSEFRLGTRKIRVSSSANFRVTSGFFWIVFQPGKSQGSLYNNPRIRYNSCNMTAPYSVFLWNIWPFREGVGKTYNMQTYPPCAGMFLCPQTSTKKCFYAPLTRFAEISAKRRLLLAAKNNSQNYPFYHRLLSLYYEWHFLTHLSPLTHLASRRSFPNYWSSVELRTQLYSIYITRVSLRNMTPDIFSKRHSSVVLVRKGCVGGGTTLRGCDE